MPRPVPLILLLVAALGTPVAAQVPRAARVVGNWEARGPDEAIHHIMVRSDSSAQFGEQLARWRVVGDSLWLTLGDGVWMVYGLKLESGRLTLSGGDLEKPVVLRRVGAATTRPDTLVIPEPPPPAARAWE